MVVLKIYFLIPTFDYAVQKWENRVSCFLVFDGKDIYLVVMRGGYRIASLSSYGRLFSVGEKLLITLHFSMKKVIFSSRIIIK